MLHLRMIVLVLAVSVALIAGPARAEQNAVSDPVRIAQALNATIGLITGGPGSTDARIAGDIAQVLDDGDKLRVLPMLGRGSEQNIADLIYLKGVDVAIVHTDVLAQTMQLGTIPKEGSVQYIAPLFPEEIHILARKDIASLSDLNGKPVAIGAIGSGTELTAITLLATLQVTANLTRESVSLALDSVRRGDTAAMILIGGKPVPLLQGIDASSGLHFLPIPLSARLVDAFVPTTLDHLQYPNLIPAGTSVDTVAVGSVLVTLATSSDSARAKRVNRFVDTLFERFDRFYQPGFHPKWQEVTLAAQVPGLTRYPEAAAQLRKPEPVTKGDRRGSFNDYVSQSGQTANGIDSEQREALFRDFLLWRAQHNGP
jgi:TRAP transporter TAXI family solute receptor